MFAQLAHGTYVAHYSTTQGTNDSTCSAKFEGEGFDVACKVSATMVWTPNPSNPSEPAPKSAIVFEQGTASYIGEIPDYFSGSCNDGAGNACQEEGTPGVVSGSTEGVAKYTVKTDPGSSFTINTKPEFDITTEEGGTGTATATLYTSATPVLIDLAGTTPDAFNKPTLLTGQGVTANLIGVSLPSNFQWNVTGSVFKDFTVTTNSAGQAQGLGFKTELGGVFLQEPTLSFFTLKEEEITISCTANALLPDGTTKPVQAETKFQNKEPIFRYWTIDDGETRLVFPNISNTILTFDGDADSDHGQNWRVKLDLPEQFKSQGGQGGFVQLFTPTVLLTDNNNITHSTLPGSGVEGLDTGFPLSPFGATYADPTHPEQGVSLIANTGDSPQITFSQSDYSHASYNISRAKTWLVFQPYGSSRPVAWVPLRMYTWQWFGSATRNSAGYFQLDAGCHGGKDGDSYPTSDHPTWNYRHTFQ